MVIGGDQLMTNCKIQLQYLDAVIVKPNRNPWRNRKAIPLKWHSSYEHCIYVFDISLSSIFSSAFQPICTLARDSISQRAAQERRWGCCTLLNCCPGRSLLTVM